MSPLIYAYTLTRIDTQMEAKHHHWDSQIWIADAGQLGSAEYPFALRLSLRTMINFTMINFIMINYG